MSNVVSKIGNIIGKSINTYHNNILKPRLDKITGESVFGVMP